MIETSKLIEKMFLEQIDLLWKGIKQPEGLVADIHDISHAYHEYCDIEKYFPGKKHNEVEVFNWDTKYMPNPLPWMNDESALYYSQTYLKFFVENYNNYKCKETEWIEMSLSYFIDDFDKVNNATNEQINLAKRIVSFIKPTLDEEINIPLVCQCTKTLKNP